MVSCYLMRGAAPFPARAAMPLACRHCSCSSEKNWVYALPEESIYTILQYSLNLIDLLAISAVCRRWKQALAHPSSWHGVAVRVDKRDIGPDALRKWWAIWRRAKYIVLNASQRKAFSGSGPPVTLIWHGWGSWNDNEGRHWHFMPTAYLGVFVSMTSDFVPDEVVLYHEPFVRTPVTLGFTSAQSPLELSGLFSRGHHGGLLGGDLIVSAKLFPLSPCAARPWTREEGLPARCYATGSTELVRLQLCRRTLTLNVETCLSGIAPSRLPRFVDGEEATSASLRFFAIIPRAQYLRGTALPRCHLGPSRGERSDSL